jgi:hypothetical protein
MDSLRLSPFFLSEKKKRSEAVLGTLQQNSMSCCGLNALKSSNPLLCGFFCCDEMYFGEMGTLKKFPHRLKRQTESSVVVIIDHCKKKELG